MSVASSQEGAGSRGCSAKAWLSERTADGWARVFPSLSGKGRKFFNSVQLGQLEVLSSGLTRRGPPRWARGAAPVSNL